jgi:hypothetical protein
LTGAHPESYYSGVAHPKGCAKLYAEEIMSMKSVPRYLASTAGIICVLLFVDLLAAAQPYAPAGMISGKIFLITKSGDLKPARLAQVFLLDGNAGKDGDESAAYYFTLTHLAKLKAIDSKKLYAGLSDPEDVDRIYCLTKLRLFGESVTSTLKWNQDQKKDFVKIEKADEEGVFRFAGITPGKYTVLAMGQAGFNTAYWQQDVIAEGGKEVTIKLSSPEAACFVPETN